MPGSGTSAMENYPHFYTVRFDTPTAVTLEAAGATLQTSRGSSMAAVLLICVIGLIGIKRLRHSL